MQNPFIQECVECKEITILLLYYYYIIIVISLAECRAAVIEYIANTFK